MIRQGNFRIFSEAIVKVYNLEIDKQLIRCYQQFKTNILNYDFRDVHLQEKLGAFWNHTKKMLDSQSGVNV